MARAMLSEAVNKEIRIEKLKRGCRTTRLKNLVVWQLFFQKKGKNSALAEFF